VTRSKNEAQSADFADYARIANFNVWLSVRLPRLREARQAAKPQAGEALSSTKRHEAKPSKKPSGPPVGGCAISRDRGLVG